MLPKNRSATDSQSASGESCAFTGQRGNAVLIGEDDWLAIQETLFPESVPGLTESIRQVRPEGVEAGSAELDW